MEMVIDRRIHVQDILLSPCRDCIYRGRCEGEQYAEPGEFCRRKKTESDISSDAFRTQDFKEV